MNLEIVTQNNIEEKNIIFSEDPKGYLKLKISNHFGVEDYKEIEQFFLHFSNKENLRHLVVIIDVSNLLSISYDARRVAFQSSSLNKINLDLIFLNLRADLKASVQFLFTDKKHISYFEFQNTSDAHNKAFELINQRKMENMSTGPSVITGVRKRRYSIGQKELSIIHDKKWTYQDGNGNYHYEIELIDSNIFISRPSGSIEFDNSLNANVLFDKVIYEILGHNDSYYRIQDYTDVVKTSYSARRDFTNYIIKNINRIDLMVFFGLNQSMKAIVKIGKLVHPSFSKVKIVNTFDEAVAIILEHKYGSEYLKNEFGFIVQKGKFNASQDHVIKQMKSEHQQELQNIFEYIGKILWVPDNIKENNRENENYSEVYQALEVLRNDIDEIISKKENTINHMQRQLFDLSEEIKKYRQEIRTLNIKRKDFVKDIHYEIRTPIQSILTASELYQLEKNNQVKQDCLKIIMDGSKELSIKMREQTEMLQKNRDLHDITTSLFNLNNHIKKQLALYKSIAETKEIDLVFKTGTIEDYFIGDLHKINSILDHLILNAIQNSVKGIISVEAELVEHYVTKQKIRINVKDQGYGLDPKTENLVNEIFAGDTSEVFELSSQGFGNGLVVCQQLAELMDGKMSFSSYEDGSIFSFEVILDLGVFSKELNLLNRSTSIKYLKSIDSDNLNIAVWEQNRGDFNTELLVLSQLGLQALVVRSKIEIEKLLVEKPVDILFFEYHEMEDMYATVQLVKDSSMNRNIKVCGLTTNISLDISEIDNQKKLDFNLIKPFTIKKLLDIIKEVKESK